MFKLFLCFYFQVEDNSILKMLVPQLETSQHDEAGRPILCFGRILSVLLCLISKNEPLSTSHYSRVAL